MRAAEIVKEVCPLPESEDGDSFNAPNPHPRDKLVERLRAIEDDLLQARPLEREALLDTAVEMLQVVEDSVFDGHSVVLEQIVGALLDVCCGLHAPLFAMRSDAGMTGRSQSDCSVWEIQAYAAAVLEFGFSQGENQTEWAKTISHRLARCGFKAPGRSKEAYNPSAVKNWRANCLPSRPRSRTANDQKRRFQREVYDHVLRILREARWRGRSLTAQGALGFLEHSCREIVVVTEPKTD